MTINQIQISQQFCISFFLYNCKICLNGSKLSEYFGIAPPILDQYLGLADYNNEE
jgi:hypothetical protein